MKIASLGPPRYARGATAWDELGKLVGFDHIVQEYADADANPDSRVHSMFCGLKYIIERDEQSDGNLVQAVLPHHADFISYRAYWTRDDSTVKCYPCTVRYCRALIKQDMRPSWRSVSARNFASVWLRDAVDMMNYAGTHRGTRRRWDTDVRVVTW